MFGLFPFFELGGRVIVFFQSANFWAQKKHFFFFISKFFNFGINFFIKNGFSFVLRFWLAKRLTVVVFFPKGLDEILYLPPKVKFFLLVKPPNGGKFGAGENK